MEPLRTLRVDRFKSIVTSAVIARHICAHYDQDYDRLRLTNFVAGRVPIKMLILHLAVDRFQSSVDGCAFAFRYRCPSSIYHVLHVMRREGTDRVMAEQADGFERALVPRVARAWKVAVGIDPAQRDAFLADLMAGRVNTEPRPVLVGGNRNLRYDPATRRWDLADTVPA